MTPITLYNTKTRRKEPFEPIDPGHVRMYVCGPTVYDRAHIGNARPVIVFDTLYRLLRHVYGAEHVSYVRNFTDVDDKINARAAESGRDISEITAETTQWFLDDMTAVGALQPSLRGNSHDKAMPRATSYIAEMIAMIEDLIAKDHAYAAEGHVLFRVRSYAEYGALSGRSVDDMIAGARVEVAPYKEDPMDFVMWKPSDAQTPGWPSPWGRGRPGWHIECSAMAEALFGSRFDIHGGGNDLTFPHHENEIAQSVCAGHGFANLWMHNEMLQVEGKKMSKSLGNFFTVRDLLDQGVPGEVIRFVFLSTHYRKPMDWTEKKREEAVRVFAQWHRLQQHVLTVELTEEEVRENVSEEVVNLLASDLNTSGALTHVRNELFTAAKMSAPDSQEVMCFFATLKFLGFENVDTERLKRSPSVDLAALKGVERDLQDARALAMETKDFTEVDRIKAALIAAGVEVQMSKDGVKLTAPPDFDRKKLEAVL
ncbi:MAG: cysteine--tRNA ligase [Pseudomonadota bacterium]